MLHELHIRDFAIIDDLHLTFGPGLNILTGETGAGKSIIIDALGLLLGDRATTEWVRTGKEIAEVEATFHLSTLALDDTAADANTAAPQEVSSQDDGFDQLRLLISEQGLDDPENPDWLLLSREVRLSGRNICRINGRAVSLQILSEIAGMLIDVHGQGEHLSLLQPKTHLLLLDRYASLLPLRQQIAQKVKQLRRIRSELERLNQDARTIAQRLDILKFQVDEIIQAALQVAEDEELENERLRLSNAETLLTLSQAALAILTEESNDGSPSTLDMVGEAIGRIERLARVDPSAENIAVDGQSLSEQLSDLARSIADYTESLEFNPARLNEVEERLELIRTLKRKYGDTIEQIIAFGESAQDDLAELDNWDAKSAEFEEAQEALLHEIGTLAAELSSKRQSAGERFAREVEVELAELKMDRARCGVSVEQVERDDGAYFPDGRRVAVSSTGADRVEFLLSANPGEPLKPVAKVASGGETARLMLALKSVLAEADATPTLIFDEIDQGIGGRVGSVVGQKLWNLTGTATKTASPKGKKRAKRSTQNSATILTKHQILCITHLPQLAAYGDRHYTVNKQILEEAGKEHTSTVVDLLEGDKRITELMQMLGATTDAGRRSVEEMLEEVTKAKEKAIT